MDIAKPKKISHLKGALMMGGAVLIVLVLLTGFIARPYTEQKVERSKLLLGTVQRGDMQVAIANKHEERKIAVDKFLPTFIDFLD
ncbi:MAG: hypothetical protein EOO68_00585, partial [Moraxellaceae bacterium]